MWHHRCVSERPPILTGERKAAWCGQPNEAVRLGSSLPSDDLHDGVLAESHVAGDQAIGQTLAVQESTFLAFLRSTSVPQTYSTRSP
jgi:hypothetical protein